MAAAPEFVVGVEGGATKTLLTVFDASGRRLGQAAGACSNPWVVGVNTAADRIHGLLLEALRAGDLDLSSTPVSAGLCLSGSEHAENRKALIEALGARGWDTGRVVVANDAVAAAFMGFSDGSMVVISGTGSICQVIRPGLPVTRVGGWGHMIGDEGSAYDIARRAVRAVLRLLDGSPMLDTALVCAGCADHGSCLGFADMHRLGVSGEDAAPFGGRQDAARAAGEGAGGDGSASTARGEDEEAKSASGLSSSSSSSRMSAMRPGPLWEAMKRYFSVESQQDLLRHFYAEFDKSFVAGFARKVAHLAAEGDPLSAAIVRHTGVLVGSLLCGAMLGAKGSLPIVEDARGPYVPVVCVGSVFHSYALFKNELQATVRPAMARAGVPRLRLFRVSDDCTLGAAAMGAGRLGVAFNSAAESEMRERVDLDEVTPAA